jgi:methanogenic corrinoid protein MtbC1
MLADRFELAGWQTFFLGADTPEEEIEGAVRELDADLVVLSASTHFHRVRIRVIVDELCRHAPGLEVLVTGAAFAHDTSGWTRTDLLDPQGDLSPAALLGRSGGEGGAC